MAKFESELKEINQQFGVYDEPSDTFVVSHYSKYVEQITALAKKTALSALPKRKELDYHDDEGITASKMWEIDAYNEAISQAEQAIEDSFKDKEEK
jgi:hypothetical protein